MLQLLQSVFAEPPKQVLQVPWHVEQMVSLGAGRKLPSGHATVQVFEADQ